MSEGREQARAEAGKIFVSSSELINRLDREAALHWSVSIAVGFPESTLHINADDADRLEHLRQAISAGGHPVGLVAVDLRNGEPSQVKARIFPEYAVLEENAEEYLRCVMAVMARRCQPLN